jgi:membrane-associated phospholipid phosphatase
LTAALLLISCDEVVAQKSRLYEFGPDAAELAPSRPAVRPRAAASPVEMANVRGRPCVLLSARELRLPPPPDDRATARELRELRTLLAGDDHATIALIRYWEAGFPADPWRARLAAIAGEDAVHPVERARALALLEVAVHDVLIAAWDSKLAHRRPRPDELDGWLESEVLVPAIPSYPSEHAAVAGAAAGILSWIFPEHAHRLSVAAEEAAWSRVTAGAVFPSDARAGLDLGRAVAQRVMDAASLADLDRECGHPSVREGKSAAVQQLDPVVRPSMP